MKIRSSTQIAIGAVLLGAATLFGYRFVADGMLGNTNFPNLEPGKVNIVGIELGNGYAIRVANQVAQLVEAKQGSFEATQSDDGGPTEGANAKRIPIKDLLGALQGDENALGRLIMVMNDRAEDESWPPVRNIWKAEDVAKALAGDPKLQTKLESDLNMKLDGTPLDKLRLSSYQNGIIVESGVPMELMVGGSPRQMLGRIQTPYRPELMAAVERRLENKSDITNQMIAGYYGEEADKILKGAVGKERVRENLQKLVDPEELKPLAFRPDKVLKSAKVLITDQFITDARYEETAGGKNASYDLTVDLNDEGRRRLWAYSRGRVNAQLLLISNGIAIAAPRIRHELATSELTITQMHDQTLLDDMIETLHATAKPSK